MAFHSSNCTSLDYNNGVNGANYDIYGTDRRIPRSMTAFTAIAWYNGIEILVLLFFVFKKYSGLYFWSLLITTISIFPYATGAWMKQNSVSRNHPVVETLLTLGWVILVPGQSMVLYSRLHLISQNRPLLRFIFWLIIANAFLLCGPCVVLNSGQYSSNPEPYTRGYVVMEKIQMTLFSVQEFFISGVYFWEVRKVLKVIFRDNTRKIMWQLVAMNVLIIILDVAMLIVIGFGFYMIETTMKAMVYSIKLKVELAVLTKMVSVFTTRNSANRVAGPVRGRDLEADKSVSSQSTQSTQQDNLPPHWRLSINLDKPPVLNIFDIEIQRRHGISQVVNKGSMDSMQKLYPGRLG